MQGYFKTGPGQYGEGDRFIGIPVPDIRKLARRFRGLPSSEILSLLQSPLHEARLLALLIMGDAYARGDETFREKIFRLYLENSRFVNNWDLVDASAASIVGPYLEKGDRNILDSLASSTLIWERRIAIIATLHFIRQGEFRRDFSYSGDAPHGPGRSDPQGGGLDAQGSRQAGPAGPGGFFEGPSRAHGAYHAPLCYRAISLRN